MICVWGRLYVVIFDYNRYALPTAVYSVQIQCTCWYLDDMAYQRALIIVILCICTTCMLLSICIRARPHRTSTPYMLRFGIALCSICIVYYTVIRYVFVASDRIRPRVICVVMCEFSYTIPNVRTL